MPSKIAKHSEATSQSELRVLNSPKSEITGRFRQESIGNRWNMEAVFPLENFRIFFDDFRPVPARSSGRNFRHGVLLNIR